MTDRDALLAVCLNGPADDHARLILADALDENVEGELARFVRAGVTVARFADVDLIDSPDYYAALGEIADVAGTGEPARWVAALGLGPSLLAPGDWGWDNAADRVTVRVGAARGVFARGLLTELELSLGEWYGVARRRSPRGPWKSCGSRTYRTSRSP